MNAAPKGPLWRRTWENVRAAFGRTDKTELLLRGSLGSFAARTIGIFIRLASGIVLARALDAAGFGVYAYAIAWLATLTLPTTLGMDQVALRYVATYGETRQWPLLRGVLRYAFLIAGGGGTIVAVIAVGVTMASPLEGAARATMLITLALLPIVVVTQVRQTALRALDRPVLAQIPEFLNPLLLIAALGIPLALGQTPVLPTHAAWVNAAAWLGAFVVGVALLAWHVPADARRCEPQYRHHEWRKMIMPLVFFGGAYHLVSRADVLVLGAVRTSAEVGVYTVAMRGAELMLFTYDALTQAGAGLVSRIHATGDRVELQRFTTLIAKSIFWITLPAWLLLMVLTPTILGIFGPEFVDGTAAMRLLATAFFISSMGGIIVPKLYATGHQKDVAIVTGLVGALNVAASLVLVPRIGMMGAAIASATSLILWKGLLVVVLFRREGVLSLPFTVSSMDGSSRFEPPVAP